MKVQVIRSNRKTIGLEVRADESVILRAPQWLSEKELDEWIGEHAYWIEEKVKQMRQRNLNKKLTGAPAVDEISDEEWKSILRIYRESKPFLQNYGGHRWQNHYPQSEDKVGELQLKGQCEF